MAEVPAESEALRYLDGNFYVFDAATREMFAAGTLDPGMTLRRLGPTPDVILLHLMQLLTPAKAPPPPTRPGHVEWADYRRSAAEPFVAFEGTWVVPPAPRLQDGQAVMLIAGLMRVYPSSAQPAPAEYFFPTLQWGRMPDGTDADWRMVCWYGSGRCSNLLLHSTPAAVSPGEQITVTLKAETRPYRNAWVGRMVSGGGRSTELSLGAYDPTWKPGQPTPTYDPPFDRAWILLEAYRDPMTCDHYPNDIATVFSGLRLRTAKGSVTPKWKAHVQVPGCDRGVKVHGPKKVSLYYRSFP